MSKGHTTEPKVQILIKSTNFNTKYNQIQHAHSQNPKGQSPHGLQMPSWET